MSGDLLRIGQVSGGRAFTPLTPAKFPLGNRHFPPVTRLMAMLCLTFVTVFFSQPVAVAGGDSSAPRVRVGSTLVALDSINLPIFVEKSSTPALVLRAAKFYAEKKQKGFLRIGLWRVPVVEGFELRFVNQAQIGPALRKARRMVPVLAEESSAEFRDIKFIFPGDVTLVAGRARWGRDMTWFFSGNVQLTLGTNVVRGSGASLRMVVPGRGNFVLNNADSTFTTNLFSLKTTAR